MILNLTWNSLIISLLIHTVYLLGLRDQRGGLPGLKCIFSLKVFNLVTG